ncbi:hypothetical protein DCAR_0417118 [Daucus carota subsp. sativus]|uniref:WEB family protein n=1 Tax=Daucus carota subsp. sativus TaxID=79200 RepID=A0A162ABE2_DAUCS|nr:PREDICTED: WEB family protein At1g75720 [Daucus carota subsp. sativus]WOG97777.1 hypothetical protein DCAR_0417118 [Daucus carota subsp. sativus]
MVGEEAGGVGKMKGNAEIDTSAPFRSVKEAVALFGERVLAGDVYHANRLQQMNRARGEVDHVPLKINTMTVELEETKENLQKAIDEGMIMATCLSSLQKELQQTKRELQKLKQIDLYSKYQSILGDQVEEDVKHVEDVTKFEVRKSETINHEKEAEFQKKKYVRFANEPCLTKFIVPQEEDPVLERHPSLRKKKKKPLIPLIGGIFSRKKGNKEFQLHRMGTS